MLKGAELLAKIKEMGEASKTDIAIACGYVTTKKDGSPRVLFTHYYEAIIDAKGVDLGTPAPNAGPKRGKAPSYKATIAKTGTCPVGGAYTSQAGWAVGDEITIVVDGDEIRLKRTAVGKAASSEALATPAAAPEPLPVVVTEPVVTYDSAPTPAAERELAPF